MKEERIKLIEIELSKFSDNTLYFSLNDKQLLRKICIEIFGEKKTEAIYKRGCSSCDIKAYREINNYIKNKIYMNNFKLKTDKKGNSVLINYPGAVYDNNNLTDDIAIACLRYSKTKVSICTIDSFEKYPANWKDLVDGVATEINKEPEQIKIDSELLTKRTEEIEPLKKYLKFSVLPYDELPKDKWDNLIKSLTIERDNDAEYLKAKKLAELETKTVKELKEHLSVDELKIYKKKTDIIEFLLNK